MKKKLINLPIHCCQVCCNSCVEDDSCEPAVYQPAFEDNACSVPLNLVLVYFISRGNSLAKYFSISTGTLDRVEMAESDWDSVTYLRKKTPRAAELKSKQVSDSLILLL